MLANTEARAEITPLVRHDIETPSGIRFTAACFQGPGSEWSLAPLQEPEDTAKSPRLTQKIRSAMRHLGADRIYAPSPVKFNGKIVQPESLNKVMHLGHGVLLFRNAGVPADGTFLHSARDAGIFSAGGCGVIVAALGDHVVFAHAGRDCVIDRQCVLAGAPSRSKESVVDSIVDALLEAGHDTEELRNLYAWVLYSIRPEDFFHRYDDPVHAAYNLVVGAYLAKRGLSSGRCLIPGGIELDIPAIIRLQFMQRGVPQENVSLEHAYLAKELPTTRNGGGRYLVAIARQS